MRWTGRASCQNGSKSACRGYCISIQLIAYQTGEKLPKMGTFRDTDVSSDSALKLVPFVRNTGGANSSRSGTRTGRVEPSARRFRELAWNRGEAGYGSFGWPGPGAFVGKGGQHLL